MDFGMEASIPLGIMTERLDVDGDAQYTNESEYGRKLDGELVLIHESICYDIGLFLPGVQPSILLAL